MFQTFTATSSPEQGPPRLKDLRQEIANAGLTGFLIPRADAHQGEYVAPCDGRLEWLTGFSGSAGFCAVLPDIAGVFIDGRYRLQVSAQVAGEFTPVHWPETQLSQWLIAQLPNGGRIGFDPWLHTVSEVGNLRTALAPHNISLCDCGNLVDQIWAEQPAPPTAPFTAHTLENAGETHDGKRARIAKSLIAPAAILTLPDSIAWLLNIRGSDIARNPVPQCFAILHSTGHVDLFAGTGKAAQITEHLGDDVRIHDMSRFLPALAAMDYPVQIDPKSCPELIRTTLTEIPQNAADPCILPKARKNKTEVAGARAAHLRDGAAMVNFLAWLSVEAPKGALTEIDVVTKLEGFRAATNQLRDVSFETICGAGPNGAIVHYRVTDATNRAVNLRELLLVDSGGQYVDGTTDITRTIAIGPPQNEHRICYTRVLQGMIAISRARFPHGIAGQHIDALARAPLWLADLDYDHGTGHGVGSYLCVHEGPQGISRRATTAFEVGMIVSNEPGYYREGAFGIRIENLIVVEDAPNITGGDARKMLQFETLTYVPFDRNLIDLILLSRDEIAWIDTYHAQTFDKIGPRVSGDVLAWLTAACAPL